jgi:hypothetical protein
MLNAISKLLDWLSEYLALRKGLLPLIGILLIVVNFVFRLVPAGWVTTTDLFLHLGIIIALLGILLAWAL